VSRAGHLTFDLCFEKREKLTFLCIWLVFNLDPMPKEASSTSPDSTMSTERSSSRPVQRFPPSPSLPSPF